MLLLLGCSPTRAGLEVGVALMDWSDETEARLEEQAKQADLCDAPEESADIRAALEEIRRVTAERDEWKRLAHVEAKGVRCAFEERAEAAEVEVERLRESASRHVCESHTGCADLLAAAIAKAEGR